MAALKRVRSFDDDDDDHDDDDDDDDDDAMMMMIGSRIDVASCKFSIMAC